MVSKQLLLICLATVFSLTVGCQIFSPGENILIKEIYNPRRSLKAIIFEKGGNATVNNSVHVLIADAEYVLNDLSSGNVFIFDKYEGMRGANIEVLVVNWSNDSLLIISYPNGIRVFKQELIYESSMSKVTIDYQSD